jgi:hypothetical protein
MKRDSETSRMPGKALLLGTSELGSDAPVADRHANLDPTAHGRTNMNTDTEIADHERRMTMTDAVISNPPARRPTWRDVLPIHPAADAYPPVGGDELAELGADIKAHGLKLDVVLFRGEEGGLSLLDGRSRLDALEAAGFVLVKDGELDRALGLGGGERVHVVAGIDPVAFADSHNLRRRHLTRKQKRARIEALLRADPEKSDRRIASEVGEKTSHKTVAVVRADSERRGEITHVPVRRDTKGRRQPALKVVAPAPTPKPELKPNKKPTRKEREQAWRAEAERVAARLIELDRDLAREVHEIAFWGDPKTMFLSTALARGLGIDV